MRLPGYTHLLSNVLYPSYTRLVGRTTYAMARDRIASQYLPQDEIRRVQLAKLKTVLASAGRNVPYYRELFKSLRFDPAKLTSLEEFEDLEFTVTKSDLREQPKSFISENCNVRRLRWHHTGGSTGEPLFFPTDVLTDSASAASMHKALKWWGVQVGERHAMLWGSPTFVIRNKKDALKANWTILKCKLMNRMFISNYDLNDTNILQYRNDLEKFQPTYVRGMPSSLYLFARTLLEQERPLRAAAPRVVHSACEQLFDWQKEVIEQGFNAPVANTYGLSEFGDIAFGAPCGNLHIMDEDNYIELRRFGSAGDEIVATQLNNLSCPLIKYRTNDIAEDIGHCSCPINLSVLTGLKGRAHDLVVTPDGRYLHGQLFTHLIVFEPGVTNYQVRQRCENEISIALVVDGSYDRTTETRLREGISRYMGSDVSVSFDYVQSIPLTAAGKHRWIVSDISHF